MRLLKAFDVLGRGDFAAEHHMPQRRQFAAGEIGEQVEQAGGQQGGGNAVVTDDIPKPADREISVRDPAMVPPFVNVVQISNVEASKAIVAACSITSALPICT